MPSSRQNRQITASILVFAGAMAVLALFLTHARGDATPEPTDAPALAAPIASPTAAAAPVLAAADPTPAVPFGPPMPPPEPKRPRIDVVFALDTTGSMAGLLSGAKQKIWSLANEIASGQPRPIVRFGLIGYRDIGDDYVTKRVQLTEDMDVIYHRLMAFRADGGGDAPEHVNKALQHALNTMEWSQEQDTLKLIFLVGDAPPHDDYEGPTSAQLARRAQREGIIINTLRAGHSDPTRVAWSRIASITGGTFASIEQTGGMKAVATPYDRELEALNRKLADTGIGYGSKHDRELMRTKIRNRKGMSGEAAASAASYSSRGGGLGKGDLISALEEGSADLEDLDASALSDDLRAMSESERNALIKEKAAERARIKGELARISKQRDAWLSKRKPKRRAAAERAFDSKVMDAVEAQAADIGVAY